jgi:hypothetical protein
MTESLLPPSSKDNLINKPVHTRDGFLIGKSHIIDNGSIVVARSLVATIFYHIPMHKVRKWDGHALWLNIDDKESKGYILPTDSKNTPLLTELFTNRPKEEIISMARRVGKNIVQSTAIFIEGEKALDLNSFLSWLEAEMDNYSIEIRHTIKDNGNHHTYILKHDAGENYSLYYKTVLELIFEEALRKNINILTSNNATLVFEFENKPWFYAI